MRLWVRSKSQTSQESASLWSYHFRLNTPLDVYFTI